MGNKVVRLLRDVNPSLYAELHPTLNTIDTTSLTPSANKKVWWKCRFVDNHYWQATVAHRTSGTGCSMCKNKYIVHGINDLSVTSPLLYKQIHPTMNNIDTTILAFSSNKKIWWQCQEKSSHYWPATVNSRNGKKKTRGCGMCSGRFIVSKVNDLSTTHPDIYAELDVDKTQQEGVDTSKLFAGSEKRVWWKCAKDDRHVWSSILASRTRKDQTGCPVCLKQLIIHEVNDLSVTHPSIYSQLHIETNLENGIDISVLASGSAKKVWWQCSQEVSHVWEASLYSRTGPRGNSCPMCVGQLVKHGINDLSVTFPKLYDELHQELNKKDGIATDCLSQRSPKKVWWKCLKNESHYWKALVSNRTASRRDGCAMCAGLYVVNGVNDLSVLNPILYSEIHPNMNTVDTSILTVSTAKKVWWQCMKNTEHYWNTAVAARSSGSGCPHCVTYRNESEFRTLFTEETTLEFKDGHVIGERELFKRNKIQIDMINHEYSVIIEYDGAWTHGGNKLYKTTLKHCLARDTDTTNTLLAAGYKVVRIRETPLQFLDIQHENLFQVAFKDRDDKLPVVTSAVEALQTMGVEIEIRKSEVNELQ